MTTMTRPPFTPSPNQQAIFDWVQFDQGCAIVIAVAGSGKTTTVKWCLPLIPEYKSVHLFAFNLTIAQDLKAAIDQMRIDCNRAFGRVRASTFHSVGFGAVCKKLNVSPKEIQVDGRKLDNIMKALAAIPDEKQLEKDPQAPLFDKLKYDQYASFVFKLVSLAKGQGIGALVPDTEDIWFAQIKHHDLYLEDETASEAEAVAIARRMLKLSNDEALNGHIDYDDQLYLPLLWRLRLWQNDWVFVDEAQDTNPVRRAIAKLALRPGGRLVAVGDPRQAIYGFTGASHDALDLIKQEFNCVELPLTVCYRCGSRIVAAARQIVPYIQAAPGKEPGVVFECTLTEALRILSANDAILCRNTAPLVELCFQLIGEGRPCKILGKDIGQGLISLIRKQRARTFDQLELRLAKHQARETAKFMARGEEQKADSLGDRIRCITVIMDNMGRRVSIDALCDKIASMFAEDGTKGVLLLSTVHKAKGREWPAVAIYAPELMPSPWARQHWQAKQEENLKYVAITRAENVLMYVPGEPSKKKSEAIEQAKADQL